MVERADICRRHGPASRATCQDRMPRNPLEAMAASAPCRTEALGGHVYQGMACGALEDREPSCKNRHCPTCQPEAATPWLEKPRERLLPVPSLLVTLTLPEALRPVARSQQRLISNLLCQTSAATLKTLAQDPDDLGGQIGLVGVLPTWTREMASHPPSHDLGPGGARSPDGSTGRSPRYEDWLVPVRARSNMCRGQFQEALTKAGLLEHVPPQVWQKAWVVHGEPAGTGNEVLTDLAPYIRRLAITNNHIEQLEDGRVTFRFKESGRLVWKHLTLPAAECIRRFLHHVRPKGFLQVRSDGFLSPHGRQALAQSRTLLQACPSHDRAADSGDNRDRQATPPTPEEALHGRTCGGPLVLLLRLSPNTRGPPS
jgi:Putative transposase/Transposase zinc-binding domain